MTEKDIEDLIKKRIIQLKLVDSGDLLRSIKVTIKDGEINIKAIDYFQYLDKRYNIMDYVVKSTAFTRIMTDYAVSQILDELNDL